MRQSLYEPSMPERFREAWLKRATSFTVAREIGPMQWSSDQASQFAWEEPNFFVLLLANREPVQPVARVELSVQPGSQHIQLAITPPAGHHPVDNTEKRLLLDFTSETLNEQIDRAMEAILVFFRCVRSQWSWAEFQARFQESR